MASRITILSLDVEFIYFVGYIFLSHQLFFYNISVTQTLKNTILNYNMHYAPSPRGLIFVFLFRSIETKTLKTKIQI